jgi:hypothetical protein
MLTVLPPPVVYGRARTCHSPLSSTSRSPIRSCVGRSLARAGDLALLLGARPRHGLVEPPRAPDLAPQRERAPELDPDLRPRPRTPARLQHPAQDAVDAEPGVPEAGRRCRSFPLGLRGARMLSNSRRQRQLGFRSAPIIESAGSMPCRISNGTSGRSSPSLFRRTSGSCQERMADQS